MVIINYKLVFNLIILYFKKQDIFKFVIIKNRRVGYFRKMLVVSGYCGNPEIRNIFIIFAAKVVSGGRGIKFITITINITIAITIRQFKRVIVNGGSAFSLIFAFKLFVFINQLGIFADPIGQGFISALYFIFQIFKFRDSVSNFLNIFIIKNLLYLLNLGI